MGTSDLMGTIGGRIDGAEWRGGEAGLLRVYLRGGRTSLVDSSDCRR